MDCFTACKCELFIFYNPIKLTGDHFLLLVTEGCWRRGVPPLPRWIPQNSHLGALRSNSCPSSVLQEFSFAVNLFSFKQRVTM